MRVSLLYLLTYSSIFWVKLWAGLGPWELGAGSYKLKAGFSILGWMVCVASTFCGCWRQIVLLVWGFPCHSGQSESVRW